MASVPRTATDASAAPIARGRSWSAWLTSKGVAAAILVLFYALLLASVREKSMTVDELGHATAGYTYWKFGDYRLNPENGILPQRLAALPLLLMRVTPPARDAAAWQSADGWSLGYEWFYRMGNDADRMLFASRSACAVLAVALGALVWWWSRRLFGPGGGLISLVLYVLSPTVLANGPLVTSDLAPSLFFAATTLCVWRMLHRLTIGTVLCSSLAAAGLFLSKMSAPLILPIAATLCVVRLARREPLPVSAGGRNWNLTGRGAQAAGLAVAGAVHVVVIFTLIWAAYGFRYSAFAPGDPVPGHFGISWATVLQKPSPEELVTTLHLTEAQKARVEPLLKTPEGMPVGWSFDVMRAFQALRSGGLTSEQAAAYDAFLAAPPTSPVARCLAAVARGRLLPEAFLYGYAHVWRFSQTRAAFLNGDYRLAGWRTFFPYTFLIKTPLAFFGIVVLALAALARWPGAGASDGGAGAGAESGRGGMSYDTIPLWVLWVGYWVVLIPSHIDIGHRHILPTYPPLFVLCGACVAWLPGGARTAAAAVVDRRWRTAFAGITAALLLWLGLDAWAHYPNYLAYFNPIAGGEAHAYRHLVDSSLDWGQDLRAVRARIDSGALAQPVYLAYFGNGSPKYYGVRARLFHGSPGWDETDEPTFKMVMVPAAGMASALSEELRRHPDYDPNLIGHWQSGDQVRAMLVKKASALRLGAGTYCISATLLQTLESSVSNCFGPWNARYEGAYQELAKVVAPLLDDSPAVRRAAVVTRSPDAWLALWRMYDEFRFGRLAAYLRHREPETTVNGSILVYRLTDADLKRALEGPPAELGRDVPREIEDAAERKAE
ncbi:MAG TPA: glycosyltransferase family 39 protein [Opitutaceae bacterium]|nr:glycosyltransferase family 39 protein [Opitutaceae bacterium]